MLEFSILKQLIDHAQIQRMSSSHDGGEDGREDGLTDSRGSVE